MKVIAVDALLSIAKDVTLANGAKHRCIDATQIHELPKTEIIRCKDCKYYWENAHECTYLNQGCIKPEFFCGYAEQKEGDGE